MVDRVAIYHLSARVLTRAAGASARAACEYIARLGHFARGRGADVVAHVGSENMPRWAQVGRGRARDAASAYWTAADRGERSNGVLARRLIVALPRELDEQQQIALARRYVRALAGAVMPASWAIHSRGADAANPHMHVLVSERQVDGHDRDAVAWFRRAAPAGRDPASGGAKKMQIADDRRTWLLGARQLWADAANDALMLAGCGERISALSHADLGLPESPTRHRRRGKHHSINAGMEKKMEKKPPVLGSDLDDADLARLGGTLQRARAAEAARRRTDDAASARAAARAARRIAPSAAAGDISAVPGGWLHDLRSPRYAAQIVGTARAADGTVRIALRDGGAIFDRGSTVETVELVTDDAARWTAVAAVAKGWTASRVQGSDEYVRAAARELSARGIRVDAHDAAQAALVAQGIVDGAALSAAWTAPKNVATACAAAPVAKVSEAQQHAPRT